MRHQPGTPREILDEAAAAAPADQQVLRLPLVGRAELREPAHLPAAVHGDDGTLDINQVVLAQIRNPFDPIA